MTASRIRARPLTIASRRSALALAQTGLLRDRLRVALDARVSVLEVTSEGDVDLRALVSIGGTGIFVSALREALDDRRADLAVHSLKDLPTTSPAGLVVAAIPVREQPVDVLVAAGDVPLDALPAGARVGTGAPRRAVQLASLRPDLDIVTVRGNVDSRIAKVRAGELDAIVLARAGLARLGRLDEVAYEFSPTQMLPAPGQGALAVECRADDPELVESLRRALDDDRTRACVEAERAVLARLEAGCSAPVGALARIEGDRLVLDAVVGGALRDRLVGAYHPADSGASRELGVALAQRLIDRGAVTEMARLTARTHHTGAPSTGDRMGIQ